MKRVSGAIVAILALVSTQGAHADFFLERTVDNAPEKARIERISIGDYAFSDRKNAATYGDSLFFLSKAKNETYRRYEDGRISYYRFSDAVNELEYLAYHLDNYFANLSSFERTGSRFYKELAMRDLETSRTSYDRLKAVTRKK